MAKIPVFKAIFLSGVLLALAWAAAASGASFQMTLKPAGTVGVTTPPLGTPSAAQPDEIDSAMAGDDADGGGDDDGVGTGGRVNRSIARSVGKGSSSHGGKKAKSNPEVKQSFDGVNFYEQRFSNHGNQFSVEPPDQGLCVGNGFVLESANDVLRIFDTAGNPKAGPIDLNTFYGYPAAVHRAPPPVQFGPSITDPSCIYDADTQRWFHVVLTLDRASPNAQTLAGTNHLDIAVSTTSDPTGSWVVYSIPAQNNGTQGTPNHHCNNGFCLGDYPHIGADANGIYLTTNEFALFGPGFFYGANVYAINKHALASLASSVPVVLMTAGDLNLCGDTAINQCAFTVWPAQAVGTNFDTDNGGTEFFMSSLAVFTDTGDFNEILVWSLTNTQSLNTATPALTLTSREVPTLTYGVPPRSNQQPGNTPLRDCLADGLAGSGINVMPNCYAVIAGASGRFNNPLLTPDSNDSRMQQVYYANGKLWSALDTAVQVPGDVDASNNPITRAGIAYFIVNPNSAKVMQQGIVAISGNNVSYPAVAATASGRGVMAFTLMGNDNHPSAAYTSLDTKIGAGDIHVIAAGAGPQDGFSGYRPLANPPRPRWGDYGAAATDGKDIWVASEYTAQTCTYAAYLADPTCGLTRGALGNWATRITQTTP